MARRPRRSRGAYVAKRLSLKTMKARIDQAVAALNVRYAVEFRIVWGYPNKEEEQLALAGPKSYRRLEALLSCGDDEYEVWLSRPGDSHMPGQCLIFKHFDPDELPRTTARSLYNVLTACDDAVNLCLLPEPGEDDPEILVCGVSTYLPAEAITARTLNDALHRLYVSARVVQQRLSGGDDYDRWAVDRGE
jgi:hypothetical protein